MTPVILTPIQTVIFAIGFAFCGGLGAFLIMWIKDICSMPTATGNTRKKRLDKN